jgi:hypothetical protein
MGLVLVLISVAPYPAGDPFLGEELAYGKAARHYRE